jgi:urocanate hydratase
MSPDNDFQQQILQGIPEELPEAKPFDSEVSHAPKRKDILSVEEKKLAVRNALRYFHPRHHGRLAVEFLEELQRFGRIYMYRFRPTYKMHARPLNEYPHKIKEGGAIMMMIQNNLDPAVAQHPHELITYGGNGAVFQNWAQYLLTMKYLATMTSDQTLHMYSGHPMGLFPSSPEAPRVVVTNGMMIPNYSKQDDWEKYNALGVTQYGQMTAGSYMYIGPQGIVHGTTITILNAGRKINSGDDGNLAGKLFVSSGLGGMSGAQPKAASIAGCISVVAEVNEKAISKRHSQGWVDEVIADPKQLVKRVGEAKKKKETVSIGYHGNIVTLWELLAENDVHVDLGSDQTSLHNPWAGGYYPVDLGFDEANEWMAKRPDDFKKRVQESLRRQVLAINHHASKGTYFFDYGNAFLLEASRAGADVFAPNGIDFRYASYVQDIMGPMCFDFGFGPFRWVCTSGSEQDLSMTDQIASEVLEKILETAPAEIHAQLKDNLEWIRKAASNRLVVGSKARILYADAAGRIKIAKAFNEAIRKGKIGPVVLGRDHHDVSGTDSPYRETSNIYDGSRFTADMAIHNVIGDSFRGATWVSIHNGGGVGWGEVMNGGFGLLLDGSEKADKNLHNMLYFDVTNGIARRAWARNSNALSTIHREHDGINNIKVTLPSEVDASILDKCFSGLD